ncbi:MAG: DUF3667 domain-containing protein [Rhizobiales bacterium]|nr:DUF3667 domain-containing protein [Rhizobacter sp.]
MWRSLKLLLIRPGELTREYLDGRRRRYVLPLRLYLTISLIALLLLRVLTVVDIAGAEAAQAGKPPRVVKISVGFGEAELREGVFSCTNLPAWVCERLKRRLDIEPKLILREISQFVERSLANVGAAMFVLLPGFALWLRLVYRNRGLNYTEHLVFALHVHAFWFVMLGLMLVDWMWLTALAGAAVPLYTLLAMRRVYAGRWWPRLLRAGAVSVLYGLTMVPTLMALFAWVVLF